MFIQSWLSGATYFSEFSLEFWPLVSPIVYNSVTYECMRKINGQREDLSVRPHVSSSQIFDVLWWKLVMVIYNLTVDYEGRFTFSLMERYWCSLKNDWAFVLEELWCAEYFRNT